MKKVLFLCYYFPPMGMGGTQRSTKFVKYLPKFKWEPVVVTVKDVHYYAHDNSLLDEIRNCQIVRTESFDPLRLLARFTTISSNEKKKNRTSLSKIKNIILNALNHIIGGWLLIPDSKILWLPFAIRSSLSIIKRQKIKIIYTTSPPHSAHLGGLLIKFLTGTKWVADFRDDWTGGESQANPTIFHRFTNRLLEKFVLKFADQVIGMCDHLTDNLRKKSGSIFEQSKFLTIMNGYDRGDFSRMEHLPSHSHFTITHCGSISRVSDPEPFLKAMQLLFQQHPELANQVKVQFFGTDIYGRLNFLLNHLGLNKFILPIQYLPHRDALKQVMQSHLSLLTIIKKTDEEIITGKVFEYLASGKPILLISSEGEVTRTIRSLNRGVVIKNQDIEGIKNTILSHFQNFQAGKLNFHKPLSVPQFDREFLTGKLADVLSGLI